jgi:hypothetical protein
LSVVQEGTAAMRKLKKSVVLAELVLVLALLVVMIGAMHAASAPRHALLTEQCPSAATHC